MIKEFIDRFYEREKELKQSFEQQHPGDYLDVVKRVITILHCEDASQCPDPERIHEIDDESYQGTLVYVIGASGYQPTDYWYVRIFYGSCSGCDLLESIRNYSDTAPTPKQVADYMTLALHIVQGMKKMQGEII